MGTDIWIYVEGRSRLGNTPQPWKDIDEWNVTEKKAYATEGSILNGNDLNFPFEIHPLVDFGGYQLYGILADVRHQIGTHPPVSKPKGLPDDLSPVLNTLVAAHGDDFHDHSWLTLKEMASSPFSGRTINRQWVFKDEYQMLKDMNFECDFFDAAVDLYQSEEPFEEMILAEWYGYLNHSYIDLLEDLRYKMKRHHIKHAEDIRIVFWFGS